MVKPEIRAEYVILLVLVMFMISISEVFEGRELIDLIGAGLILVLLITFLLSQIGVKWR